MMAKPIINFYIELYMYSDLVFELIKIQSILDFTL